VREERGIRALKAWAQSGRLGLGGSGASGDHAEVVAGEVVPGLKTTDERGLLSATESREGGTDSG
jgi:hypothetical protein